MKEKTYDSVDVFYTVPIDLIRHQFEDSTYLPSNISKTEVEEPYKTQSSYYVYESFINNSRWQEWESILEKVEIYEESHDAYCLNSKDSNENSMGCIGKYEDHFQHLCNITNNLSEESQNSEVFLRYVRNAIAHHKNKVVQRKRILSAEHLYTAAKSFMEFLRYVPAFSVKPEIKVYVDDKTGYFGIIYKKTIYNAGTLNILVKDNFEIDFSYAKKRKGIVTITGVAKFGRHHENSDQILSLFKLME